MAQARGKWLSSDPVGRAVASDAVGRRGPTQVAGQGVAKITQSGAVTHSLIGTGERGVCSRCAQRVLRYGDMEYVMLYLIFIYLMPGEGQPAAYAASDL